MWINRKALALLVSLVAPLSAYSEDIDIFSGVQENGPKPNLMVLLDNSAAWDASVSFNCEGFTVPANNVDKAVGFEQCALYNAVQAIGSSPSLVGNINMGLMLFGAGSTNGGKLKLPPTSPYVMPAMDAVGIANYSDTVANLDRNSDKSNGSAIGAAMQEVWAYYKGATGLSTTSYIQHFSSACQRNFVVYIANANNMGKPQDQGKTAEDALKAAGATTAQLTQINIPSPYDADESNWADEWARFMVESDLSPDDLANPTSYKGLQNIITYTIIVSDGKNPEYVKFLQSMAVNGGGKAFVVSLGDMDALVQALLQIFNEIQGVNTAFASASLPVSTNAQGINLNQIFLGVFRPDINPRWQGNLKQYKLGIDKDTNDTILVDAKGNDAISSAGTGFISPNAVSCWTTKNTATVPDALFDSSNSLSGGYWWKSPQGASNGYDSEDGEIVEKGGAHQRIRLDNLKHDYSAGSTNDTRKLYTCTSGCGAGSNLSSTPFALSNSSIQAVQLGTSAPAISIKSIKRSDSGLGANPNTATVELSTTPNPALFSGQTVTISGSSTAAYNGPFSITVLDETHFTIPLSEALISPPSPATGSYTVSWQATQFDISSLTRNGATATAITDSAHTYGAGDTVTVAGATQPEYNGQVTIVTVPTNNSFTYSIIPTPSVPSLLIGTATVGTDSVSFASMTVTGADQLGNSKATLTATQQQVGVKASSNFPKPNTFTSGNTVTISGVVGFNGTYTIDKFCASSAADFCFTMSASPVSSATTTGKLTASTPATSVPLVSVTRAISTCAVSSSYSVSGLANVKATATTPSSIGFNTNQLLTISGPQTANEGAYNVNDVSVTVTGANTFTYPITVAPSCEEKTSGMLATPSGVDRDTLVRWVRGEDNARNEASPDGARTLVNIRPSVHGDVLHSRPAVVNYNGDVIVFYGSNDGVFHAINGNQESNPIGSTLPSPGSELWGFIPEEFFPKLNRLRNNSPQIQLSTTPTGITPTPLPKDYFFDGSPSVYKDTAAGKVYLYITARRGGSVIYALDITNPQTPKFMWKHTDADADFLTMGQTWSQPRVIKVKGHTNPVVVFGGGYDIKEDEQPARPDTVGNAVFIVDAVDGSLVWKATSGGDGNICVGNPCALLDMTYAIPADLVPVDRDFDGYADRIYVPDLGGHVWRIDLEANESDTSPSKWQVELLASVGGTAATGSDKRKIFFAPAVVASSPNYDAVVFVTGDREHPLSSDAAATVTNRFYMIKDFNSGKDGSKNPDNSPLTPVTDSSSTTAFAATTDLFNATSAPYDNTLKGFYINLPGAGEKAVNRPLIVGSTTYFATNAPKTPDPYTCQANLGTATAYQVDWFTGKTSSVVLPGGGMPPSAVEAIVKIGNETRDVIIGGGVGIQGGKGAFGAGNNPAPPVSTRKRSFWYEKR